jgi:IQ and AAA domain-containing protein
MVHPQKRVLMKEMLDNLIVRMCEVKQNVIKYATHTPNPQTDYVNLDDILMDLKLTPKALSLPLPRFYTDPSERDNIIKAVQKELGVTEEIEIVSDTVTLDTNMETAIRIIQKLERGRQGIIRGLTFAKMRMRAKDRSAT